jgi:hypothetical protein
MAPITLTTARLDQVMTRERTYPAACATPTCKRSPSVCAARHSMMLRGRSAARGDGARSS